MENNHIIHEITLCQCGTCSGLWWSVALYMATNVKLTHPVLDIYIKAYKENKLWYCQTQDWQIYWQIWCQLEPHFSASKSHIQDLHAGSPEDPKLIIIYHTIIYQWKQNLVSDVSFGLYLPTYALARFHSYPYISEWHIIIIQGLLWVNLSVYMIQKQSVIQHIGNANITIFLFVCECYLARQNKLITT
jgi:hypothetical protein